MGEKNIFLHLSNDIQIKRHFWGIGSHVCCVLCAVCMRAPIDFPRFLRSRSPLLFQG
jgi:hypothetical protein